MMMKQEAVRSAGRSVLLGFILLCQSCRTNPFEGIRLGEMSYQDVPLADCVDRVNVLIRGSVDDPTPPQVRLDLAPADVTWIGVDQANSNAAVSLIAEYATGVRTWSMSTNGITFKARGITAWETARILAALSGAKAYVSNRTCTIRLGPARLQIREYKGGDWVESVDLRRNPDNASSLAVVNGADGFEPLVHYVPDTDTVIVLGTAGNHESFRRYVKEFTFPVR